MDITRYGPDGVQHFRNLQPVGPALPLGRRIEVELHGGGKQGRLVRVVTVPADETQGADEDEGVLLNLVWKYGQNDVQPLPGGRSLCEGDVVRLPTGTRYVILGRSFGLLPPGAPPPDAGAATEFEAALRLKRHQARRLAYLVAQTGLSPETLEAVEEAAMRFEEAEED